MKPLQIGLFVLVGALGGAVIMKVVQRPKPAAAPVASVAPAPVPARAVEQAPAAPPPPVTPVAEPAPQPEAVRPTKAHQAPKIVRQARAPVITVARNLPPVQPSAPPAPEPVQQPPIPAAPVTAAPPISSPEPVAPPEPSEPAEPRDPPAPSDAPSVTLQSGMVFTVRLGESLSSEHNQAGDTFTATLDTPVQAGGFVIAERGARVEGRVVEAQKAKGVKGGAVLALELTRLATSDGQHVPIQTESLRKQPPRASGDDVGMVAAAAGIGAVIGAIAGGGKGAAIGAGAGGAAGVGGVAMTRAKAISLPTETRLSFRLKDSVTVTERLSH